METLNESSVWLVTLRSLAIYPTAGENMLEARGEMRVMELISANRPHFLGGAKF